jgi:hypothetical protein
VCIIELAGVALIKLKSNYHLDFMLIKPSPSLCIAGGMKPIPHFQEAKALMKLKFLFLKTSILPDLATANNTSS